jgi:hypothetical protein
MDLKLLNLPASDIYKDLLSPGMKKVGDALSIVLDSATLILLPLKLLNDKARVYFESNLDTYKQKLENKPGTIIPVPQYIGLPILDKFTYLEKNELSEAFTNLLAKASFEQTLGLAHPSFITVLNNLSVDEARILFHYRDIERIPFLDLYVHKFVEKVSPPPQREPNKSMSREEFKIQIKYTFQDREDTYIKYAWNLAGIENEVKLDFPENIDLYIENLYRLGLFSFEREIYRRDDETIYNLLKNNRYKDAIEKLEQTIKEEESKADYNLKVDIRKGSIQFTEIGRSFVKACIQE